MHFSQIEAEFQALRGQFRAGALTEEEPKAQLEEPVIQDEEGKWWIIGYETGQWYYHDGEGSVRGEPPPAEVKAPAEDARRPEAKREPEALPSPPARRPWGWVVAAPGDPRSQLEVVFAPKSTFQYTGWECQRFDQLLDLAKTAFDAAKREALQREAYKILCEDDVVTIPIRGYERNVLVKTGAKFEFLPFGLPHPKHCYFE